MAYGIGLKFTHDGGVAIFEEDRLIACYGGEKVGNGKRYSEIGPEFVLYALAQEGIPLESITRVVVDGWAKGPDSARLTRGDLTFPVHEYGDRDPRSVMSAVDYSQRLVSGIDVGYTSPTHVGGHIASSYATSPFAQQGESAYVVMWDGGTTPRLFHVEPGKGVRFVAGICNVPGSAYSVFPLFLGPFRRSDEWLENRPSNLNSKGVAGKAMALAGLGNPSEEMLATMHHEMANFPGDWKIQWTIGCHADC